MRKFTEEELKGSDGKNGKPSYVAMGGNVYDVSASGLWKNGVHMGQHHAGNDLTEHFVRAPHCTEVFERVKLVGKLKKKTTAESRPKTTPQWAQLILALHSHPIMVHFPQAFFSFAPIFLMLFYLFRNPHFERTAYFLLVSGFIMITPTFITGLFHWVYKYGKSQSGVFKFKIVMSLILFIYAGALLSFHTVRGAIPADPVDFSIAVMYIFLIPIIVSLGYAGGTIVFGGRK
ncbi:MAG: DUF2231 domain-containing protein [bacterium]